MAFNFNNSGNPDLNLVKVYNQRAATVISNGKTLIPLRALHKSFPSPFEHRKPRVNQDDLLLCQAYQPPNDMSCNASVNPNANGDRNRFNGQVQSGSNYSVDQRSRLGPEEPAQQLGCPSGYVSTDTDPVYQYPVPSRSTSFFPDSTPTNTVKRNTQFGNNTWGVNNDSTLNNGAALSNRMVPTWSLSNGAYKPHSVAAANPSIGIGSVGKNIPTKREDLSVTSAMTAGVSKNSLSSNTNTFYPTATTYPGTSNSLYPNQQTFFNSCSTPRSSFNSFPASTFEDNEPGLYEQIGERTWRCTYNGCGQVTRDKHNRTRHIGTHAKWEEKLIEARALKREDAIAIPRAEFLTYECDIPDCRYFLETGERFYVEDYRVDGFRAVHLKNYHGHPKVILGE